jgi:hypothetical protein
MTSSPDEISTPRIGPTMPIGGDQKKMPASSFQSMMQQAGGAPGHPVSGLGSPFDLAQRTALTSTPTLSTLITQVTAAQGTLGDISTQFNTPNLKLKQSRKYLLKNKMGEANDHIFSASSLLGLEPSEPSAPLAGPFGKFIGMISDGQNKLKEAQGQLQALKDKGQQLTPGDMLLVQVKLNLAQQELEYSSVVLSKAIDDMKMLFNIQL